MPSPESAVSLQNASHGPEYSAVEAGFLFSPRAADRIAKRVAPSGSGHRIGRCCVLYLRRIQSALLGLFESRRPRCGGKEKQKRDLRRVWKFGCVLDRVEPSDISRRDLRRHCDPQRPSGGESTDGSSGFPISLSPTDHHRKPPNGPGSQQKNI